MRLEEMDNPEIVFNLWFVYDEMGMIYSLRARAYLGTGTEEDKLLLLQKFSTTDYLIAQPFAVPEQFHTTVVGTRRTIVPVALGAAVDMIGGVEIMFEEAFKALQSLMPAQTKLRVNQRPLVCITPLFGDSEGNIYPKHHGERSTRASS